MRIMKTISNMVGTGCHALLGVLPSPWDQLTVVTGSDTPPDGVVQSRSWRSRAFNRFGKGAASIVDTVASFIFTGIQPTLAKVLIHDDSVPMQSKLTLALKMADVAKDAYYHAPGDEAVLFQSYLEGVTYWLALLERQSIEESKKQQGGEQRRHIGSYWRTYGWLDRNVFALLEIPAHDHDARKALEKYWHLLVNPKKESHGSYYRDYDYSSLVYEINVALRDESATPPAIKSWLQKRVDSGYRPLVMRNLYASIDAGTILRADFGFE